LDNALHIYINPMKNEIKELVRGSLSFYLLVAALACAGCGGGSSAVTLSSIAVTPADPSVTAAADEQFTATGTYSDGSTADLTTSATWSSSDEAVATIVSTSGLATAVAAGTATITATDSSGTVSGTTVMTVTAQELIDVHAHATIGGSGASAQDLASVMTNNDVSTMTLMMVPTAEYQAGDTGSENMINFFNAYSGSFRYMYGGSELQPLLFAKGYNGAMPITSAIVYPRGGTFTAQNIADFNAINAGTDPAWATLFQNRATAAAQSGRYAGFGELAPLHVSSKSGQPYMTCDVDNSWLLWLSDLAAQYTMVLDIHVEATTTTLTQFATLLSHNTSTKIIWDHAGWTNLSTSTATAAVFSQMLADHSNLYLNLKMRDGQAGADTSPVDSDGNIKSEWLTLLTTYADRIMVGTDAKYWTDSGTAQEVFDSAYSTLNAMLEQLPSETAVKIRKGTAQTLFGLTQ
jgi:hypothetical protein